ncbi:zinc finger CCCH domain-containing protein 10-like [Limulus polyphemus]|uniref:Zinc finger CCCH domain-containing protein 10-like n=1 Tax=Limulus polyphemus TaxID=6850 RepID=A0ABM1SLB5_LIMPO|nr:zinc finger CCCH domain-containing protein 10-like [Limulus polyphemus]XP_022244419.1 zinc finger CCCH domain-containing protein 10-like [Limulus polyphemus]XP_022244420.1 zinc finger CCCH domain-containing protein 10-like [Limulus polyphemus]XP_022244421.1 zinc finger CCCH domain-containing protein 10-like [Limulus polyphemus]
MSDDESRDSRGDNSCRNGIDCDDICRDFLRNVCRRGRRCKYKHPEAKNDSADAGRKQKIEFCHDFQNKECNRASCKFLHCTRKEEEFYHATGKLPEHIQEALSMGRSIPPLCKDFLKGFCRRKRRCKFRHVSIEEYNIEMGCQGEAPNRKEMDRYEEQFGFDIYEPEAKRRAFNGPFNSMEYTLRSDTHHLLPSPMSIHSNFRLLEEENVNLQRKVEELKQQVTELTATNEFLLDQNAQLRLSKQATMIPVSQVINPHTMSPSAGPIPQTISQFNSDLAATLPRQRIAPELTGPTPHNMTSIVHVTLAQQGMAPVTITGVSQNLCQTISISAPSTPLVSYPIMTQSLRPVIPHSLNH